MPSEPTSARHDLVRSTLAVLAVLALLAGCFWIVKPFLPALLWASTIVIATWPALLGLEERLGRRRGLAVAAMTLALLLVLLVPLGFALATLVDHADEIAAWAGSLSTLELGEPPAFVERIPVAGGRLAALWRETAAAGAEGLLARLAPYADKLVGWLVGTIGGLGVLLFQFFLTVLVAAVLYARGETAAEEIARVARRLAGEAGARSVALVAATVRGVALGVVVTALAQALLGGLGLAVCGVPSAGLLTAAMLILGVAQLGPAPVLAPATIWLYWRGEAGWGTALLVWTIVVGTIDNFLRPALIRRGADLPFVLVFIGVVGGLVAFGVVGLFVGPVVLAVAYKLLGAWAAGAAPAGAGAAAGGAAERESV
jgi:predicted PurR-regulated permease PerM